MIAALVLVSLLLPSSSQSLVASLIFFITLTVVASVVMCYYNCRRLPLIMLTLALVSATCLLLTYAMTTGAICLFFPSVI